MRSGIPSKPGDISFGAMPPMSFAACTSFCSICFSLILFSPWTDGRDFLYARKCAWTGYPFLYIVVFLCYIEIIVRLSEKLLFFPCYTGFSARTDYGTRTSSCHCPIRLSDLWLKHAYTNAACQKWAASRDPLFYANRGCGA